MRDGIGILRRRSWQLACLLLAAVLGSTAGCHTPAATRGQVAEEEEHDKALDVLTIGDATEVSNVGGVAVSGVGLVSNLEGTGGSPPGEFRAMLEKELNTRKVPKVREILDSPDYALVLVSGMIPPGSRKGDPVDIEVTLPPGSKATSLRGGYLVDCYLRDYNTTQNLRPGEGRGNQLMLGHILVRARGPVLAGFGSGDEESRLRRGRIWEGGVSFLDRPFVLTLRGDKKFDSVAGAIAQRINSAYPVDTRRQAAGSETRRLQFLAEMTGQINDLHRAPQPGKAETAKAMSKDAVVVRVPIEYRLSPERYLRVVRCIPLRETAEGRLPYRQRLHEMLLDPGRTVRAALRLEALGKASVPALKDGLKSPHPLVRFCTAESLAYLGSSAGVQELTALALAYPQLRAYALTALASLDEPVCRERLADLMDSPLPELRYGAFRALRWLDEQEPRVQGELVGSNFWLHKVAADAAPLVHFTLGQRAEVVLFGPGQRVLPVRTKALEFTVTVEDGEDRCKVGHFDWREGSEPEYRNCSAQLEDVLRTMADLGGQYADVVELLRSLNELKALSCPVCADALPVAPPVDELAAMGRQPELWHVGPPVAAEGQTAQR
jgi:hypothetical protein